MALSPLNQRRWRNFKSNRRAYWSLMIFALLFGLSLFAEVLANDRPLLVNYRGEWRTPFLTFYSEADFGGDFVHPFGDAYWCGAARPIPFQRHRIMSRVGDNNVRSGYSVFNTSVGNLVLNLPDPAFNFRITIC